MVLNYHRVADPDGDPYDCATISATADIFRDQIAYLKRWFAMPSPDAVVQSLTRGSFPDPTALVTFDDGYRDNFEAAFPILRRLGVPACFFVVTGLLDSPRLPWWDQVAYSIKRTAVERLRLDRPECLEFDFRTVSRERATWRILRACKDARPFDEPRFVEHLAARTGVAVDAERLGRALFMSWDEAREMARAGMTIGSHTVTHAVLASLPEAGQQRELTDSRARIGEMVGSTPSLLAYPVGGPAAFTSATRRLARDAGYRAAFTYFGRLNSGQIDPYAVRRMPVEHTDTWAQFRTRLTLASIRARL